VDHELNFLNNTVKRFVAMQVALSYKNFSNIEVTLLSFGSFLANGIKFLQIKQLCYVY